MAPKKPKKDRGVGRCVLDALRAFFLALNECSHPSPRLVGGRLAFTEIAGVGIVVDAGGGSMYIVKADNPDVRYTVSGIQATDSEGNVVPDTQLTIEVASDNPGAVEVVPDADPKTGSVHFGAPNADGSPALANVTVGVKLPDGTLAGSFGAQFTVTPGDPSQISGGTIAFEGLTPA